MKKKRMHRGKKPVLTSPWKIGMLVSLLLVFMSIGVGCYLVTFYNVGLKWIKVGSGGWSIDSNLFFKEAYPLAAGVTLVSLFAYLLVTSAVRRYKFYLDSGQDYRNMISLAESVDDLTNPAQIARLSSYPELQAVLRNYGDQIRDISQDLGTKENAVRFDELENDIDNLLNGEGPGKETIAGREYASIYGKVYDRLESSRERLEKLEEVEKRGASDRRSCARAALAYGRAMEAISGAGEELLAITNAAAELNAVADTLAAGSAPKRGSTGSAEKVLTGIVNDMESSVRKLEDGGHVLHEFSEENNGIAINLALMAARGHVEEHDLATFAERVRSTAERFHKLSGTVSSIAQGLLGTCYALKEKVGDASPAGTAVDPSASGAVVEIARRVEQRSGALQKLICTLGGELQDVHELLERDRTLGASGAADAASPSRREAADLGARTNVRPAEDAGDSSEFVIDHGKAWDGMQAEEPESEKSEHGVESFAFKNLERAKASGAAESPKMRKNAKERGFSDMSSLRELDHPAEPEAESVSETQDLHKGESWMEMPGHHWLKIDVEKAEVEEETGKVEVTVEPPARESRPAAPMPERTIEDETVIEPAEEPPLAANAGEDAGPVYDLFDLGAVEYSEETPARR